MAEDVPGRSAEARKKTVLWVDDDPGVRAVVRRLLEQHGLKVVEAPNALEALELLQRQRAVDLVLADVVMPGMSGVDLAKQIRELRPQVPIIFLSAYIDDPLVRWTLSFHPNFIPKPFTAPMLLQRIDEAIG